NVISGHVKDATNGPITNVDIYSYATNINGFYFDNGGSGLTDSNGFYSINVPNNSTWTVGVGCGGSHGLDQNQYQCVGQTNVTITNNNPVVDFIVQFAGPAHINGYVANSSGVLFTNLGLYAYPVSIGPSASTYTGMDNSGHYQFNLSNGCWGVGVSCCCGGSSLNGHGYLCPNDQS